MNWFGKAKEFKDLACGRLSPTDFLELEFCEIPNGSYLPKNMVIQATEIPAVYKVQDEYRGESGLRYFMDGVQRTILWQHYNFDGAQIPVFLHFSGAVIVERIRADRFVPFDALYRSAVLVPAFIYEKYRGVEGLENTGAEKYWDINEIRAKASTKSRVLRQQIEQELMHRFLAAEKELLIKDGNIFGTMKAKQVVGLIKTHRTLYLQEKYPLVQQMIWNMSEFYRSMNFSMHLIENGAASHRVNSFYLRIHQPSYPEMGLLRIEYNREIDVNELSSWLIAERCIRANCPRWDRQIYPIQVCEDYLRTQIPPSHQIQAVVKSF
ncbi:MAG: hypothetical protein ABH874_08375 [Methanobacteriota archaeon]